MSNPPPPPSPRPLRIYLSAVTVFIICSLLDESQRKVILFWQLCSRCYTFKCWPKLAAKSKQKEASSDVKTRKKKKLCPSAWPVRNTALSSTVRFVLSTCWALFSPISWQEVRSCHVPIMEQRYCSWRLGSPVGGSRRVGHLPQQ